MDTDRNFKDSLLRAVALIGLVLVLLLGAWGIILLAFNLPTIASNVGNSIVSLFSYNPDNQGVEVGVLEVSAPNSVRSGSPMTLSWTPLEDATAQYAYTVSYACKNGLSLKAPMPNGQYQTTTCGVPFNYVNASGKMTLIPTITGSVSQTIMLTVSAENLEDNAVVASGSVEVTVTTGTTQNTGGKTTGGTTNQPTTTYVPAQYKTTPYGYPDLAVKILSVNSLSSYQGRVAVQFEVTNVGTNIAPQGWMFSATLPVGYAYTYNSQVQQALYPGDKIIYTLTYDRVNNNQYCTLQYPNYNCPNNNYQNPNNPYQNPNYNYQNPNQYPQYGTPQTCYRYDGYQNIPTPCLDADGHVIYNNNYNYSYNQYPGNYGSVVSITIDPRNFIFDQNRINNTASIAAPLY